MNSQNTAALQAATSATLRESGAANLLAVMLLLMLSTAPLFAVANLPSEARGTLAAVFPPGTSKEEALAAVAEADGLVVRAGSWGAVLIAHSDKSGFARRLRETGAWLVIDPQTAAGCLLTGWGNRNR